MPITLDPTLKLSDLLTVGSILVAAGTLGHGWANDRAVARRGQLAETRTVLSNALLKLERWAQFGDGVFDVVQPLLVRTSEGWAQDGRVEQSRDFLWGALDQVFLEAKTRIRDDAIGEGSISLYRINRHLPEQYRDTLARLTALLQETQVAVQGGTEAVVMGFGDHDGRRQSAEMGNQLRAVVKAKRAAFVAGREGITEGMRGAILAALRLNDAALVGYLKRT